MNINKQIIFNYLAIINLLINLYTLHLFQQKKWLIIKKANNKDSESLRTNENHSDDLSLKTENRHSLAEVNQIIEELKRKKINRS